LNKKIYLEVNMFLSNISVKHPVPIICLIIGLTLLGINSYRKIGVESFPKADVPYITIITIFPGASPEQLEVDVAKKIENQVVSIAGLKHVTSSCMENVVNTLLEFEVGVDVDIVATDVREKIDLIKNELPEGVEDPKIVKFDINAKPIITLALIGNKTVDELYDYADNVLRDKISVIEGVADVSLLGGKKLEVQVLIDRNKLAARNLTTLNVVNALKSSIQTIPSGRIKDNQIEYSVEFKGEVENIKELEKIEVANENGQRCYIRDIGKVELKAGEERQKAYINGKSAIIIKVIKKSESNAVKTIYNVRKVFNEIQKKMPADMQLIWAHDDSAFIESSVNSAWENVFEGVLLTSLILFLFLYNFRSLLIIFITMPLTIIIGLFFMYSLNFTLNISTLLSIGLSVGILVTNSIVVLESIISHFKENGNAKQAAINGTNEVALAVIASVGTNLVVLFPITTMGSIVGIFLRPFALTMIIMTFVSLIISFTITPILASQLLKKDEKKILIINKMENFWNKNFQKISTQYRNLLIITQRKKIITLLILIIVALFFFYSMIKFSTLGFSFIATTDMAELVVKIEYPVFYSLEETRTKVQEIEKVLKDVPELKYIVTTIGKIEGVIGQTSEGVYLAQINMIFSEKTKRKISLDELQDIIREKLNNVTDCVISINKPTPVGGSSSDLEMEISGPELSQIDKYALMLQEELKKMEGIKDADVSVRPGKPKIKIIPERAILSDIKFAPVNLGLALRGNLEGITAGIYKRGDRSYDIKVKLEEEEGKNQITNFLFPGGPGRPVILQNYGKLEESATPILITRKDKQRIAKLYCNLKPGFALGNAAIAINKIVKEKIKMMEGYELKFTGMYERMEDAQKELGEALIIAVILLILTLSAILESFRQPFIILLTLPLTLPGIYWALYFAGLSISIFVTLSIVMMIGIVVNNAILIVTEYNLLRAKGITKGMAMNKAAVDQLRPILMITLAAVLGMLPLALGTGIGSELRNDIGLSSAGGILVSGILTIIVIPIVFNLVLKVKKNLEKNNNSR